MASASGSFSVSSWKEDAYDEPEGPEGGGKLTRATVELAFSGAIDGVAAVEWLMAYRADGTAHFVGLARLSGSVDGRMGTFVLENTGEFDGMVARGAWSVVRDRAPATWTASPAPAGSRPARRPLTRLTTRWPDRSDGPRCRRHLLAWRPACPRMSGDKGVASG